jgi:hypothetical protein
MRERARLITVGSWLALALAAMLLLAPTGGLVVIPAIAIAALIYLGRLLFNWTYTRTARPAALLWACPLTTPVAAIKTWTGLPYTQNAFRRWLSHALAIVTALSLTGVWLCAGVFVGLALGPDPMEQVLALFLIAFCFAIAVAGVAIGIGFYVTMQPDREAVVTPESPRRPPNGRGVRDAPRTPLRYRPRSSGSRR